MAASDSEEEVSSREDEPILARERGTASRENHRITGNSEFLMAVGNQYVYYFGVHNTLYCCQPHERPLSLR